MGKIIVCSYGMGVDSTALLILLKQKNIKPDLIIFADTGGEKPETYHYKKIISSWIEDNRFPLLVTVKGQRKRDGKVCNTLEDHCLAGNKLPSIAYGKKACSIDWKRTPVQKYLKANYPDRTPHYWISYNADELRRATPREGCSYPLVEEGWGRLKCLEEIAKEGLPIPCKSACFFCPSSKKNEILALARLHPDLADRAVKIEREAQKRVKSNSQTIGLGRHWKWEDVISNEEQQLDLLSPDSSLYCDCVESGVSIEQYWKQFT